MDLWNHQSDTGSDILIGQVLYHIKRLIVHWISGRLRAIHKFTRSFCYIIIVRNNLVQINMSIIDDSLVSPCFLAFTHSWEWGFYLGSRLWPRFGFEWLHFDAKNGRNAILVKSNYWSIINAAFWLVCSWNFNFKACASRTDEISNFKSVILLA